MTATTTSSGLVYEELTVGEGTEAASGCRVTVHYTGWLTDGTKFDSSKDRGAHRSGQNAARHDEAP